MSSESIATTRTAGSGLVLLTLASGQFLMTLDSSVMNVSIAQVAADLDTTVTGIQTAITLYTLVMATTMITGGKLGAMLGRRRAFSIGCVIYGLGSLTTSLAPNLAVLLIGWSLLEGLGAALIMPAIVALVAVNFETDARPRAYGLVAAAGAIAVAAGPLIGGTVTTYWTWRLVFAGEVVVVAIILVLSRKIHDERRTTASTSIDLGGALLSAAGLGLIVFGVLRSGEWGWIRPDPGGLALFGISATFWFVVAGLVLLRLFVAWELRVVRHGKEPLVQLALFRNAQLVGGLTVFLFQFLLQAGLFFAIPLYLSVALGLSALDTGIRLLPLSVTLLLAAVGIPRAWPNASPRTVSAAGLGAILAGILILIAALDAGAGAEVVTVPLLLVGLGVGALASQLGAVTVSAVPDRLSSEVGGLQNTATNLGASFGTALAGSVLIGALTASFVQGIKDDPRVPDDIAAAASVELAAGIPFVSDRELDDALAKTDVSAATAAAVREENSDARLAGLKAALAVLAVLAGIGTFLTRLLPRRRVGSTADETV